MQNNTFICPTCGRQSTDYQHNINKTLVSSLARLNAMGGRARLDNMGLSHTQFTNFQKLGYFKLAYQTGTNSEWQITELGLKFLQGRVEISRFVITRNGKVIRESPELVDICKVKECVQYKIEWQDQAKQPTLFD